MKVSQSPDDNDQGEADQGTLEGQWENQTLTHAESRSKAWEDAASSTGALLPHNEV